MSSTRQAVVRGPSLTGLGNRPVRTPSHQVDLPTGMRAAVGGVALGSPRIWESLTKPAAGSVLMELLQLVPEVPRNQ